MPYSESLGIYRLSYGNRLKTILKYLGIHFCTVIVHMVHSTTPYVLVFDCSLVFARNIHHIAVDCDIQCVHCASWGIKIGFLGPGNVRCTHCSSIRGEPI